MGFVVLAGLFEPDTAVGLFEVAGPEVLRVDGGAPEVGRRLTDVTGSVGFDGLEDGVRFIARGVLNGLGLEVRCRSLTSTEGSELAQPPVAETPQAVGTQERVEAEPPNGLPDAILQVGVPAGLPLGLAISD